MPLTQSADTGNITPPQQGAAGKHNEEGITMFTGTKAQHELLRAIAAHCGIAGEWGGWLKRNGKPVCQGWAAFWQLCQRRGWIVQHSGGTWLRRGVVCDGWRIDWRRVR